MRAYLGHGYLQGAITAPPSKSYTQRAYAAALLHAGSTLVHGAGNSSDEQAAFEVIQQLGAIVNTSEFVEISSRGIKPVSGKINVGESGLAARLFTPIAAISEREMTVEGKGSLLKRPMDGFSSVFSQLGVKLAGYSGYLPFTVQGPMLSHSVRVNASDGSQFLSGLLFALSSVAKDAITIEVTDLKSRPYIDMTLDVLAQFGKPVAHNNYKQFYIDPALFHFPGTVEINIEGDWSSAAGFLVGGAIGGDVVVKNLDMASKQADKAVVDVLQMAGASIGIQGNSVATKKSNLHPFDFDATHSPDLFPILAILATCCGGESSISGVHRLFFKESNRVESITEMLQDFAVPFSVEDDKLFVSGMPRLQGTVLDSYNDHRIVMAAAIGAIRANGPVEISGAEAVNKSYPRFFDDYVSCGGNCKLI